MADYKAIHGKNIQSLASDLDNAEGEGQIWFNTTSGDYKTIVKVAGTWATGGALNNGRKQMAGVGIYTAGIMVGGSPASHTEQYDGASWTEIADLNTPRNQLTASGQGTTTAAVAFGGSPNPSGPTSAANESETWDGSSWTEGDNLNTARRALGGGGTSTAALAFGGQTSPTTFMNESEEYDGSSWTEGDNLNTGRNALAGAGSQTAGIAISGRKPAIGGETEIYDGSSWTEVADLNSARHSGSGCGISTAALCAGGEDPGVMEEVEAWDGTAWTEVADISERAGMGMFGTLRNAVVAGGTSDVTTTEDWDWSSTLSAGAWSSGGDLNTARYTHGGFGSGTTAALIISGATDPITDDD